MENGVQRYEDEGAGDSEESQYQKRSEQWRRQCAEQGQCDGRARGSHGDQSILNPVLRQSPDQHCADADADGQQREREPRHPIREMQNGFGIDEHILGKETRDRPEKDFSWDGKAQQPFCLNCSPSPADRGAQAAGCSCGRDVGDGKGCNQTDQRQGGQGEGRHPDLVTGGLQEKASGCRARQDGGKGPHLQQAIAGGETFMRNQLGENAVFRRAEQRAVHSHPA